MKLNHIYKSIACGVLLAMTATSCDLDYNPVHLLGCNGRSEQN